MDIPALTKLLDYGLLGILLVITIYALAWAIKKAFDTEEKRVSDITEITKTVTIALNTDAQNIENLNKRQESVETTMKAIMITLEKQHDKS